MSQTEISLCSVTGLETLDLDACIRGPDSVPTPPLPPSVQLVPEHTPRPSLRRLKLLGPGPLDWLLACHAATLTEVYLDYFAKPSAAALAAVTGLTRLHTPLMDDMPALLRCRRLVHLRLKVSSKESVNVLVIVHIQQSSTFRGWQNLGNCLLTTYSAKRCLLPTRRRDLEVGGGGGGRLSGL